MIRDFWFIHADVIRNAIVLLILIGLGALTTALVTRWVYRRKAYSEASEYLKRTVGELRVEVRVYREMFSNLPKEIQQLIKVHNAAVGAANTVHEIVREEA